MITVKTDQEKQSLKFTLAKGHRETVAVVPPVEQQRQLIEQNQKKTKSGNIFLRLREISDPQYASSPKGIQGGVGSSTTSRLVQQAQKKKQLLLDQKSQPGVGQVVMQAGIAETSGSSNLPITANAVVSADQSQLA